MRIGIDASRTFVENPTGTERYAWEVTSRILRLPEAKKHLWVLYVKPNLKFKILNLKSIFQAPNIKVQTIELPYLWTQVGLAYRTWVDKLDVLWVPAHTLPLLRKSGIKTVVTIHGLEYEWLPAYENPLQRWYLPLSTIYAAKSASKVIAVSEFTKKQLLERIKISPEKIKVIYEGFTPNLKFEIRNLKSILNKYNLKSQKYLLFVGTIQPRKNLVRLIEAFSRLPFDYAQGSPLKLVIAGKWGWMYQEVKEAPKKFGVEDRIVFTGYINDSDRYSLLANALLYIQPSITEGFGLPVLEAMAEGVPVVSSDGGALKEVLTSPSIPLLSVGEGRKGEVKSAGLLFDPHNVGDMTSKIKQVIENRNLRNGMIMRGKERIKQFSWDKAALETYNILTVFN